MFNMIDTVNIVLDEEEQEKMNEYNVILKEKFGYESLKIEQFKVINSVLDGKDTLAIFSTGAGKSLNFQMLHLISNQNIIVINIIIYII